MSNNQLTANGAERRHFLKSAVLGTSAAALGASAVSAANVIGVAAAPELTAQAMEGPYYLRLDLVRADITEGLAGVPLDVALTVLDETGRPYAGASIDIWQCDAQGNYSGFDQPGIAVASEGKTFLRGTQFVGQDGVVVFHSVYPGWYKGRTSHIHFKVKNGAITNLTSQFFLPDTLSEFLYTQVSAYRRSALRDTFNSTDFIAIEAGPTVAGCVREAGGRYLATLTIRVDKSANPPAEQLPFMGGPPPDGPPPALEALSGEKRINALLPDAPRVDRLLGPPPRKL